MKNGSRTVSDLVRAAEGLESELERLETMSKSVQSIRLDSEKNLSRAARELTQALELPERLAPLLQALAAAMQGLQERQGAALEPLTAFATSLRDRRAKLDEHMVAFAELGKAAGEASAMLNASKDGPRALDDVKAELTRIAEDARRLFEKARDDDFQDIAREADALAKRLFSLRKRVDETIPHGG